MSSMKVKIICIDFDNTLFHTDNFPTIGEAENCQCYVQITKGTVVYKYKEITT